MKESAYVREVMAPLSPFVAAGPSGGCLEASLSSLPGIKVVVFDVYGTLLISSAGDLSHSDDEVSLEGMAAAMTSLGLSPGRYESRAWLRDFRHLIARRRENSRRKGVEFPELEIREVWSDLCREHSVRLKCDEMLESAALVYECAVNPCWEMPGATELVLALHERGFPLGVVSNAQFYTRHLVEGLTGFALEEPYFEQDLTVLSFQEGEGKPSPRLYEKVSAAAEVRGIAPAEILFIGNDMRKDIRPASEAGLRTALFAGDARSLRLDRGGLKCASEVADVILTELPQLVQVLTS